jgi:hypothetical protein
MRTVSKHGREAADYHAATGRKSIPRPCGEGGGVAGRTIPGFVIRDAN